jgi:hypothetical protein
MEGDIILNGRPDIVAINNAERGNDDSLEPNV